MLAVRINALSRTALFMSRGCRQRIILIVSTYLFSGETGTLLESPQPSSLTLPSSASLAAAVVMVEARLNLRWPLDAADGGDDPW